LTHETSGLASASTGSFERFVSHNAGYINSPKAVGDFNKWGCRHAAKKTMTPNKYLLIICHVLLVIRNVETFRPHGQA
jgi:hypothetical protein